MIHPDQVAQIGEKGIALSMGCMQSIDKISLLLSKVTFSEVNGLFAEVID